MQKQNWHFETRNVAQAAGRELEQAIAYMNDRVVPAVRSEAAYAQRKGARLLRNWADLLDAPQTAAGRAGGRE